MSPHQFGPFHIDLEKILWIKKFTPGLLPANGVRQENVGGVRIGIGSNEITIYEDEQGMRNSPVGSKIRPGKPDRTGV